MFKTILAVSTIAMASQAFALSDVDFAKAMRKDIQKGIITLKAPKLVFHWVDASDVTPKKQYKNEFPTNSAQFAAYVDKQGQKIFNKRSSKDQDVAGPGLYMAGDPHVSRAYGAEKSFGLIVGLIKPGARILTNANGAGITFDPSIVSEMNRRGCSAYDYMDLLDTPEANCTKVKQLLVGSDVSFADGRMYMWSNQKSELCRKIVDGRDISYPSTFKAHKGSMDTFVAYKSSLFSEIIGITYKTTKGTTPLAKQVLSYLKSVADVSTEQMNSANITAMSEKEVRDFSAKYILDCAN